MPLFNQCKYGLNRLPLLTSIPPEEAKLLTTIGMGRVRIPPVLVVRGEAVDHNGYEEGEYLYGRNIDF